MADYELYGLNPKGHHFTNLLFHTANVLILFLVLSRMSRNIWVSGLIAMLFAAHPLRVESVTWVAERKDVLSAFFWILSLWAYMSYVEGGGIKRYLDRRFLLYSRFHGKTDDCNFAIYTAFVRLLAPRSVSTQISYEFR